MSEKTSESVRHITPANLTNIASFLIPPSGTLHTIQAIAKIVRLLC
jgi:hypothetical protein